MGLFDGKNQRSKRDTVPLRLDLKKVLFSYPAGLNPNLRLFLKTCCRAKPGTDLEVQIYALLYVTGAGPA
jgi:hypothetical protein